MNNLQLSRAEMSQADKLINLARSESRLGAAAGPILKHYHELSTEHEKLAYVAVLASQLDVAIVRLHLGGIQP